MSKNKQLSTNINPQDAYDKLDEVYRIAVDMRIENYAYADIAYATKVKEQTVRTWFMRGGICFAAYQEKRKHRMDERKGRFQEIETQLHEMAADAILVLKRQLKKGSENAALRVLELAGFTPLQRIVDETPKESEELRLLRELVDTHENPSHPVQAERETN